MFLGKLTSSSWPQYMTWLSSKTRTQFICMQDVNVKTNSIDWSYLALYGIAPDEAHFSAKEYWIFLWKKITVGTHLKHLIEVLLSGTHNLRVFFFFFFFCFFWRKEYWYGCFSYLKQCLWHLIWICLQCLQRPIFIDASCKWPRAC